MKMCCSRRLLAQVLGGSAGNVVVLLDSGCAFTELKDVAADIVSVREAARARHGWIVDSYLLRRTQSGT